MGETTVTADALPGLACREMVELITSYLEGRLSADDRFRFERHLSLCPNCTAYLEQMRVTIALAGRIRPEQLAPTKREELVALFRDWRNN